MHDGHWLTTVARRVIVDVRHTRAAGLHERLAVLDELGTHSPRRLTDLLITVARHVPDDVIARIVTDAEDMASVDELIYREAHARYAADDRDDWVRWGESGYHRLAHLRRRERRRA
ncbi:hypothetical protein BBK82_05095 [Lentzea guizhouensis]|uniref:Uncharacterized protein n=1 Tax=Lentzea guizhouensis TaxID=1586287 RepID=A0A1B2HCW7_9PSEU|nr:hypothetical protein [Lentzea guizhouensis]ANZ35549.1 hypothetical protein BBK82_05095 [Lentzea guizhouensis]